MVEVLDVDDFLGRSASGVVLDARTPAEFAQGHIPAARNLPIFTDAERVDVGIVYKQSGRRAAMLRGLELVGPKSRGLVESVMGPAGPEMLLYCWRGGMRSAAVAELLHFFGCRVAVLRGGYKAYRRRMAVEFDRPVEFILVGGKTGSGKTEILNALREDGEQVVDLERLADHRGSAFGGIGRSAQPSQEHFENLLAEALRAVDPRRRVWLEDESRLIGQCQIPGPLWERMRSATLLFLDLPVDQRLAHVIAGYRDSPPDEVLAAIGRIQKRLGGEQVLRAQKAVFEGDVVEAARILLAYYDRTYLHALSRRAADSILKVDSDQIDSRTNARRLVQVAQHITQSP